MSRRYEQKYASWPYKLIKLCSSQWDEDAQLVVVNDLLRLDRCCLDTFSAGLRVLFPSAELGNCRVSWGQLRSQLVLIPTTGSLTHY